MKKIVLIYGSIAGGIVAAMFMITYPLMKNGTLNFSGSEVVGYTTMFIALSMIFFGVKSYRDNHSAGVIKFWKATQVGILIAVVASLIYAIAWEFNLHFFVPDFIDEYAVMCISRAKAKGATPEELQKTMDMISSTREIYKYPILRFGMTLMEIFPVGLIVTLISAAILRKKEVLPA